MMGFIIKAAAVAASIYGMIRMYDDWMFFTYFTNISNILIDIILVLFLVLDVKKLKGKEGKSGKDRKNQKLYIIKYLFTISITLTFLVYLCILAPTSNAGFIQSYFRNGAASFCVHFVTPVLAIIDFFLFDYEYQSTAKHAIYATIPPLCYVIFIVILANGFGVRWEEGMMAPYNFINYGAKCGWFGFESGAVNSQTIGIGTTYMMIVLIIIFIVLGEMYLLGKNSRYKAINSKKAGKECKEN